MSRRPAWSRPATDQTTTIAAPTLAASGLPIWARCREICRRRLQGQPCCRGGPPFISVCDRTSRESTTRDAVSVRRVGPATRGRGRSGGGAESGVDCWVSCRPRERVTRLDAKAEVPGRRWRLPLPPRATGASSLSRRCGPAPTDSSRGFRRAGRSTRRSPRSGCCRAHRDGRSFPGRTAWHPMLTLPPPWGMILPATVFIFQLRPHRLRRRRPVPKSHRSPPQPLRRCRLTL